MVKHNNIALLSIILGVTPASTPFVLCPILVQWCCLSLTMLLRQVTAAVLDEVLPRIWMGFATIHLGRFQRQDYRLNPDHGIVI